MFSPRRISAVSLVLGVVTLGGVSSCLYDAAERCDPGQRYDSGSGLCVCNGNTIAGDHGCVACGDNEVAQNDNCNCADGYARATSTSPCVIVPKGLGDSCQNDQECTEAMYASCHIDAGATGYCTNSNCATNDDCAATYGCNTGTQPSYCERPPSGAGQACTTDADCAGTDATYCENNKTNVCYVECSVTADDCFPGKECCDLAPLSFGLVKRQICVDSGTCGN